MVRARSLIVGIATYIPGLRSLTGRKTGGTVSARYCYAVWLRHLSFLHRHGLPTTFETVAELGPGDSLGVGLAALLSGAGRYIALDAARYADGARNLQILEELIALFRNRAPIPDHLEFPLLQPSLDSYTFPADLLTSTRLGAALIPARLDMIRAAVVNAGTSLHDRGPVYYIAPWEPGLVENGTVDLVLSQTVLEFTQDLAGIYAETLRRLKTGGIMMHEIALISVGMIVKRKRTLMFIDCIWVLVS